MDDTVTIDRREFDRLVAIENKARLCRARQKEYYSSKVRNPDQKRLSLRYALREERELDALLAHEPVQRSLMP